MEKEEKEQGEDWSELEFSNSVPKKTEEGHEHKMHGVLQGLPINVLREDDERRHDGCKHELRVLPTEVREVHDVHDVHDGHRDGEEQEQSKQRDVHDELRGLPTDDHVHVHETQYGQEREGELHEHEHEPLGGGQLDGEGGLPMQVEHELQVQLQWVPDLVY